MITSIVTLCLSLILGCAGYWLLAIAMSYIFIAVMPFSIRIILIIAFVGITGVSILLFFIAAKGIALAYKAKNRDWKKAAMQRSLFVIATAIALSCTTVDFYREQDVPQSLVYTVQDGEDIPIVGFGNYQVVDNGNGTYTVSADLAPKSDIFTFDSTQNSSQ